MIKRLSILILLFAFIYNSNAQIFNTSGTLKPGMVSVGFEPFFSSSGLEAFNLFLHAGVGLNSSSDLAIKMGVMGEAIYFGGDVEFNVFRDFSIAFGAHQFNSFGLDVIGLYSFPLRGKSKFYSGLDADLNFVGKDLSIPVWIPLGLEFSIRKYILFYFETELNITSRGSHYVGGGMNFLI